MKLELTLMELNDLYYGVNKVVAANREILENVPGDTYWTKQVENAELLASKLMDAIVDECAKLDEARNYVLSMQQAYFEDKLAGNI